MSAGQQDRKPPPLPGCLAMCFGLVGLAEPTGELIDEGARHKVIGPAEPAKPAKPQNQKPTKPPTSWRQVPLVKDYDLLKMIGKGGFSEVWLSEHKATKEVVAIKVVQLTYADLEPDEVATLLAEAKFLRTLDCPYLIKCKETTHTADWLIMVLEYIAGGEMFEHLHKIKKYTEADAAKLFAQIVSAISYLHNLNLMHRDIKPENIMFTMPVEECEAKGLPLRVKVIDMGMAMLYDEKKEVVGCVGTPGFVAPEIWNDKPHTFALDIYSLGVVLFIMLTGRKPHSGIDIRKMTYCNKSILDAPGLKDERFLTLSPAARELLLTMLADDPRDRPTCSAVLRHPFITAVDSNADAHREMGEEVRRRMRDLNRIRRLHGLCYAMHAQRPAGATHQDFLAALDQRRTKLQGDSAHSRDGASAGGGSQPNSDFRRTSLWGSYEESSASTGTGTGTGNSSNTAAGSQALYGRVSNNGGGGGGGIFARISGGGGGAANAKAKAKASGGGATTGVDKMALLSALPEMQHCPTMPPWRMAGGAPNLSPVPSCDPSAYSNLEDAMLPRGWSAHPVMYEALLHKDALLAAAAPGEAAGAVVAASTAATAGDAQPPPSAATGGNGTAAPAAGVWAPAPGTTAPAAPAAAATVAATS